MAGASDDYRNWYIQELPKTFKPTRWDPDEIARLAKVAGMQYVVFTTKHHDGFTLWPSAIENPNRPPDRQGSERDLVGEVEEALARHSGESLEEAVVSV